MSRVLLISTNPDLRRRWRAVIREQVALARVQECSHLELAHKRFPVDCCLIDLGGRRSADVRAVGEIKIRAHLQVLHVTRKGRGYACGVRLFPASEDDLNETISLVSRLATLPQ